MERQSAKSSPENESAYDWRILVQRGAMPLWFSLLQQGFLVEAQLGHSLRDVLSEQIGLSPDYLEERVQTIFMDGKAVDSLETAYVSEGCVVALSAAMPGFVGAAFRRGGYYAVMRSSTTHRLDHGNRAEIRGRFTLKLFNVLADELGEFFFTRGILIESKTFVGFLGKQPESFWLGIMEIRVNGVPIDGTMIPSPREGQSACSLHAAMFRDLAARTRPLDVLRIVVASA